MSRPDPLLEQIVSRPLDHPVPRPRAQVPCGACRRCCSGNSIVMLLPHDALETYEYEHVDLPGVGRGPILKRKPNGECVYLGANGCTIHERAPAVCRAFDCRDAYLAFMQHPRRERKRMLRQGYVDGEIFAIGKALIEQPA